MNNIAIIILVAVFFKFVMRWSLNKDMNPFIKIEPMIVEITDIKTNKIGEKYVQYRYIVDSPYLTYNNKIDIFTELFVRCDD